MNWKSTNFDWNHARAFLATAEEGSLSAAARALGQTQPTIGRQVTALEQELGVVLFERVGRGLMLTPTGISLRDHVALMRDAAQNVSLTAAGQSEVVEGRVAITASDIMSAYVLPRVLGELRERAPHLTIDVIAANDLRDIQKREADIAIRHVRPEAPDLIARKIGEGSAHFVGARTYFERHGRPQTLVDLSDHEIVGFGDPEQVIQYLVDLGAPVTVDNIRISSESGLVAWELVKRGFGMTLMDDRLADAEPAIDRVLPDVQAVMFPYWLTTHRELQTSRKIRLVFDHLAARLPALI